jgi:hypothetical protein
MNVSATSSNGWAWLAWELKGLCLSVHFSELVLDNRLRYGRLKANDRVNPYVAVYEVPAPSYIGDVTQITWATFLHQSFIKDALDTVMSDISKLDGVKELMICCVGHIWDLQPITTRSLH